MDSQVLKSKVDITSLVDRSGTRKSVPLCVLENGGCSNIYLISKVSMTDKYRVTSINNGITIATEYDSIDAALKTFNAPRFVDIAIQVTGIL